MKITQNIRLYFLTILLLYCCANCFGQNTETTDEDIFPREELQEDRTEEHYFKLLVDKRDDNYYERVYAVRIFDIKTDSLIQEIELDCRYWGASSLFVFDYNFDGVDDFSVFEDSYAGPNTTCVYILRDTVKNQYFESNIDGVSLEFDSYNKRVYERNQCCAGTVVTTAVYTVENDELVLLEEHCYKWDEEIEDLVERAVEECR